MSWMFPNPHTISIVVGAEHIDRMGHANNCEYLKWLEDVAWDHSNNLGLNWPLYQKLDRAMVARETNLKYLAAAFENDELLIGTWVVANDQKLSITRQYQIVRPTDGVTLLTGMTQWVCMSLIQGRAKRMPEEFVSGYRLGGREAFSEEILTSLAN